MAKTLDLIAETVRAPKRIFHQVDNRPTKPLKHRYERRKIREFLKMGDWASEAEM
jgi:hypothetical protein